MSASIPNNPISLTRLLSMGPILSGNVGRDIYVILHRNFLIAFKKSYYTGFSGITEEYKATHSKILANVETMTLHAAIDNAEDWYHSLKDLHE